MDFTEARDGEWQWHQLGHKSGKLLEFVSSKRVGTSYQLHLKWRWGGISLQTDNHASTPPLSFFTGQMPFLPPNQQRQSTEGTCVLNNGIDFC